MHFSRAQKGAAAVRNGARRKKLVWEVLQDYFLDNRSGLGIWAVQRDKAKIDRRLLKLSI